MKFKWDKKYLYYGITAFCVISASVLFFMFLNNWSKFRSLAGAIISMLSPIIIGLIVAYLLSPIMTFFETKLYSKSAKRMFSKNKNKARIISRVLSILTVLILVVVFLSGLLLMVIPQLISSIEKLMTNTDRYLATAREFFDGYISKSPEFEETAMNFLDTIINYVSSWLEDSVLSQFAVIIMNITSGVYSVIMAIFNFIVGIIVSAYVLYNKEIFSAQCKKLLFTAFKPKRVDSFLEGFRLIDKMFGGFLLGKMMASMIVGVICASFMIIAGLPYIPLISVIIAVTNIIPFIGPFIGAVPSAFLIFLENPVQCLIFIIFIIILQTFDGNILSAKILGNSTGLTGFWVIFAIMIGGGLFGFIGMVCGVPVFAVIYHVIKNASRKRLEKKGLPIETADYEKIKRYEDLKTALDD